jgi:tRNA nucleotidyltransferase (CCA-adding enzyme)
MNSKLDDLANPQKRAIELAMEVAREKGVQPFLVGGPVRDLMLGRSAIDIDLTLEEGSSNFARSLAKRIDGRVRSFPQFMTYKVMAEGLPEIDIATARKERYSKPGSLPMVSAGKLHDDLIRRDFSINAMAMDLSLGRLHDPTGGEADLRSGKIRVLHEQSFVDDPTRIFRAIRLAGRLQFGLDAQSEALMRDAIAGGALVTVSRERIWRELFLAMDEHDAPEILAALSATGALDVLFGPRTGEEATTERLRKIDDQIERAEGLDRHVLFTSVLLIDRQAAPEQLEGSGFSQKRAKTVLQIAREIPRFQREIDQAGTVAQRFRILKSVADETLSALAAQNSENAPAVDRFRQFKGFKLALRGSDLDVAPGPHVARALERAREAVFLGDIAPEDARSFATEKALKYLKKQKDETTQ